MKLTELKFDQLKVRLGFIAVWALMAATPIMFENCGKVNSAQQSPSPNVSPFESAPNSIILSDGIKKQMAASKSAMAIPKSTTLNFIVDDKCMSARKKAKSLRYFLDNYLSQFVVPTSTNEVFDQSILSVTLAKDLEYDDLVRVRTTDRCIVGISDDQNLGFGLASNNSYTDPGAAQQWYLNSTHHFDVFPAFNSQLGANNVTVAIVDTGIDLQNLDGIPLADQMIGSDYVDGDDKPQDDWGHGTALASMIAGRANSTGIVGAAGYSTKILPIRLFSKVKENDQVGLIPVFAAVKNAINAGADVVNLSLGTIADPTSTGVACDPAVGQLMYKAIEKGIVVVTSAGNVLKKVPDGKGGEKWVPDVIYSPKDNSWTTEGNRTFLPACWARYLKGAISVTAIDQNGHLPVDFGNWGGDAVEIAAPGVGITTQGLNNTLQTGDGTSYSTALVTAAVANIISFYKKNGWYYNPWMIEDTLLNGTPSVATLNDSARGGPLVRLQKSLDFQTLTNYLTTLKGMTEEQRRMQFSDNPEAGITRSLASVQGGETKIVKLEVYTKEPLAYVKDQSQVQAVVYWDNADMQVVSDQVAWSVDKPATASISSSGMFYPTAAGTYVVTATYKGSTASASIVVSNASVITGMSSDLQSIDLVGTPFAVSSTCGFGIGSKIKAMYKDGSVRYVDASEGTAFAFYQKNGQYYSYLGWDQAQEGQQFLFPGRKITVVVLYRGQRVQKDVTLLANADSSTHFISKGQISFDAVAKKLVVWDQLPEGYLKYDWLWSIGVDQPATPPNDGEVFVPSTCYATNKVITQKLPAVGSRVDNQSYDNTISFNYVGTGSPYPVTDKVMQIPVPDTLSSLVVADIFPFGTDLSVLHVNDFGEAAHVVGVTGVFSSGNKISETKNDITIANLSNDPIEQACTAMVPFGNDNWRGITYFQKDHSTEFRFTDTKSGVYASGFARSDAKDWKAAAAASSRTRTTIDLTRPVVPATSTACQSGAGNTPYAAGSGTKADPYVICNVTQMKNMQSSIKDATGKIYYPYYALGDNIDMSSLGENDTPIATFAIDGRGYWLSNLLITDDERTVTLFNSPQLKGQSFQNINITNFNLRAKNFALIDTGYSSDFQGLGVTAKDIFIENSKFYGIGSPIKQISYIDHIREVNVEFYADGDMMNGADLYMGGIVSQVSTVTNSYVGGKFGFLSPGSIWFKGGIAGAADSVMDSTVNLDIRTGPETTTVGGIAGELTRAERNTFTGSINGTTTGSAGGIVGSWRWGGSVPSLLVANSVNATISQTGKSGGIFGEKTTIDSGGVFSNTVDGTITASGYAGGIGGFVDWAEFGDNVTNAKVACTNGGCGAFLGFGRPADPLVNCPTLPQFDGGDKITASNGLTPIGEGPFKKSAAPAGITGDIVQPK